MTRSQNWAVGVVLFAVFLYTGITEKYRADLLFCLIAGYAGRQLHAGRRRLRRGRVRLVVPKSSKPLRPAQVKWLNGRRDIRELEKLYRRSPEENSGRPPSFPV